MKLMAINGSPRKNWNTATLLDQVMKGAAFQGAETKLVHLYDHAFKGCISCFACKTRGGDSYGACAVKDDLRPIYQEIKAADALVIGSPIYFGSMTGETKSFLERLLFPYLVYSAEPQSLFPKKIRTAWIYAMNAPEEIARKIGYDRTIQTNERILKMIFGHSTSLMSYDTLQFEDYGAVVADRYDVNAKKERRRLVFPEDCQKAYDLGVALVRPEI